MSRFSKTYPPLAGIGATLTLVAIVLFLLANYDQERLDARAAEAANELGTSLQVLSDMQRVTAIKRVMKEERNGETGHEVLEHFAEALFLAGIMIIFVEGPTHFIFGKLESIERASAEVKETEKTDKLIHLFTEKSEQLSAATWQAIFNRMIPREIGDGIVHMLKEEVCRLRPRYTVTISNRDYVDVPDGYVVVTRKLRYGLKNISGHPLKDHPIRIQTRNTTVGVSTLHDSQGVERVLPYIRSVQVHQSQTTNVQAANRTGWQTMVDLPVMHEDSEAWMVESEVEGLCQTTDRALYILMQPCAGLELTVINEEPKLVEVNLEKDVYLTNRQELKPIHEGAHTVSTAAGILTGTALSVSWHARP
jgi:hypothetical protein